jgi:hypothetical protein
MATQEKVDLLKDNKKEYAATAKPALIEMGPAVYLSIEGRGAPGGRAFSDAIGALYGVAFTVKMARKFAGKQDYAVSKLEALWPNMNWDDAMPDKEQWTWQLMIRTEVRHAERRQPGDRDLDEARKRKRRWRATGGIVLAQRRAVRAGIARGRVRERRQDDGDDAGFC